MAVMIGGEDGRTIQTFQVFAALSFNPKEQAREGENPGCQTQVADHTRRSAAIPGWERDRFLRRSGTVEGGAEVGHGTSRRELARIKRRSEIMLDGEHSLDALNRTTP